MKYSYFIILLFFLNIGYSQITINFTDANFKTALLNYTPTIDVDGDNEIQDTEVESLTSLDVSGKYISDLSEISYFTNLTDLNCEANNLNALDVSSLNNLTNLNCINNSISTLTLSTNAIYSVVSCNGNEITTLDLTNISMGNSLEMFDCSFNTISSLILNNTNIKNLNLEVNNLTSLDLTNNNSIEQLNCNQNELTNLNVTQNTALTNLNCHDNQLSSLNVTQNTVLTSLNCLNNQLTNLDISQNIALTSLNCNNNQLTIINVSPNTLLMDLNCSGNQLSNLDVTQNTLLTNLDCGANELSNININQNTALINLDCGSNTITNLDVSLNTPLKSLSCYGNNLTSIDVSQNTLLENLDCSANSLTNLDVSLNTALSLLFCDDTALTNLDISNNTLLENLDCRGNALTNLDVSNNTQLFMLNCSYNQLEVLDLSTNIELTDLDCENNNLTTIDLSNQPYFSMLTCGDLPLLTYINLKNGNNEFANFSLITENSLPNLQTICVDDVNNFLTTMISDAIAPQTVTFTEYCSFTPAQYNEITGNIKLDFDNNGCDLDDLNAKNIKVTTNNGSEIFTTFTQEDGSYKLYTNEGDFTTEMTSVPLYYTSNPVNQTSNFVEYNNTDVANFCLEATQSINDVTISIIPLTEPMPGFETSYQLVFQNIGTTFLDGNISLDFDNTKMIFLNASLPVDTQTDSNLIFNYSNLNPLETRIIDVNFTVFTIPTINLGDIVNFTATVNPIVLDQTPDDNTTDLNQVIIGSYDPNDIHVLEGQSLNISKAGDYLHYTIRFQNTGTASAQNIVVKNVLNPNLDWNSFQLINTSHQARIAIKNGNKIEFIFEGINLIDEPTDEPNSHGFIAYKIKPKSSIILGDIISNQANIFFDYNSAIDTNIATTEYIEESVSTNDTHFSNLVTVIPNPTKNNIFINSKDKIVKATLYNILGNTILSSTKNTGIKNLNLGNLPKNIYILKLQNTKGNIAIKKIVKN